MGFIQPGRPNKRLKRCKSIHKPPRKIPIDPLLHVKNSSPKISILERFPIELIQRIFVLTGIQDNNLPSVNSYFNQVLRTDGLQHNRGYGIGLIKEVVHHSYEFDLNKNLKVQLIAEQIAHFRSSSDDEIIDLLQKTVNKYQDQRWVISADVFNRKFMTLETINNMEFDVRNIIEAVKIEQMIANRSLYVIQQLLCYEQQVLQHNQGLSNEIGTLIRDLGCNDLVRTQLQLSPIKVTSTLMPLAVDFPARFYQTKWTDKKLELARRMTQLFFFTFKNLDRVVSRCIANGGNIDTVRLIEELSSEKTYSSPQPIIELFNKQDMDEELARYLLVKFYESQQPDSDLWEHLARERNTHHLALVMEYASPPSYIIGLMGR